jgi:YggT family protein
VVTFLIQLVYFLQRATSLVIITYVVLTYFMDYYHPVRQAMERIVEPLLRPLRRILPTYGNLDFSPFVLIILVQLLSSIIIYILKSLA